MILLRHDCLVFKTMDGECIPCSSEEVTLEIIGDAIGMLDEHVIKQASAGVLHYFKEELGKTTVTIAEFAGALERALRALGLNVQNSASEPPPAARQSWRIARSNLSELAGGAEQAMELVFFSRLRAALQEAMRESPDIVHFRGLKPCVKQLLGAQRWTHGCQSLRDQIVDYLRTCFDNERREADCALVVC